MKKELLKPCPFCGSKAYEVSYTEQPCVIRHKIYCPKCHANIEWYHDEYQSYTSEETIDAWNKRFGETKVQKFGTARIAFSDCGFYLDEYSNDDLIEYINRYGTVTIRFYTKNKTVVIENSNHLREYAVDYFKSEDDIEKIEKMFNFTDFVTDAIVRQLKELDWL